MRLEEKSKLTNNFGWAEYSGALTVPLRSYWHSGSRKMTMEEKSKLRANGCNCEALFKFEKTSGQSHLNLDSMNTCVFTQIDVSTQ